MTALPSSIRLIIKQWPWILMAIGLFLMRLFPSFITQFYTRGFFKGLGTVLRTLSGGVPFAIGEFVYFILIIILIFNILKYVIKNKNSIKNTVFWTHLIQIGFVGFLQFYIVFQIFWGLNYAQEPPTKTFQLNVEHRTNMSIPQEALNTLLTTIASELNSTRHTITDQSIHKTTHQNLETMIVSAYKEMEPVYPFLALKSPNFKQAFIPGLGDYIGYLAFYQPITGEAIIRSDLPLLIQPFTMAHEFAHQIGFASETEANFIAFVVSDKAQNPLLRYSMLLQLYQYVQSAQLSRFIITKQFDAWKAQLSLNRSTLSTKVISDQRAIRAFFNQRAEKQIESANQLYNQFLIWNKQAAGVQSYADVVGWVMAYRKKMDQAKTGSSTSYSR